MGKYSWTIYIYAICVMTRCAETERVPPATGVMVSAVELPTGFRTVSIKLTTEVVTRYCLYWNKIINVKNNKQKQLVHEFAHYTFASI